MASGTIASEEDTQEHSYVNTTKEYYHPLAWQTQHDRQYRTDWCTFRRRWELFEVSYRLNKRLQEERWQPFSSVCQQTFVRLGVRKITMRRRQRQERHDIGSSAYLLLQQEKRHLWPVQFHSKSPETRWVVRWLWSMIAIAYDMFNGLHMPLWTNARWTAPRQSGSSNSWQWCPQRLLQKANLALVCATSVCTATKSTAAQAFRERM